MIVLPRFSSRIIRRAIARTALAVPLFALVACTKHAARDGLAAQSGVPAASIAPKSAHRLGVCDAAAPTQTVTFVHVNDLHARYDLDASGQSPFARIRGYYEQVRRETPHVVFTDGGDVYEKGSVAELLSKGAASREALHAMAFDVRVLGNHDFAWGGDEVVKNVQDPHAKVLASNIKREGLPFPAKEYTELEVGCVKIGFFGLVPEPFDEHDKSFSGDFLPGYRSDHDVVKRARELVEKHRGEVQLLVLISHLGKDADIGLAKDVPGIDAILGGHSHDALDKVETIEGRTAMIQTGHHAEHIGRLALTYDFAQKRVSKVDYQLVANKPGLPVDESVQKRAESILSRYAPEGGKPLATVTEKLGKTAAAELAARAAMAKLSADAAIVDDAVAAEDMGKGPLTQQAIANVYPVQRQPPNTPGFTSFYTVDVSADDLAKIQKELQKPGLGKDLHYVGPKHDGKRRSYRLAVNKALALEPAKVPGQVVVGSSAFGCEAWEAVDAYARSRTAVCLHLDKDAPVAGCTPKR